jgi:phage major head subunit gpT-like protein
MLVNAPNLQNLRVGFQSSFQGALGMADISYQRLATVVNSSTAQERYGWIGKMPSMREWLGPRVIQNVAEFDYSIKNKDYEMTVGVERNDIEDDNLGNYASLFEEMGQSAGAAPNQAVYNLLKQGFTTNCYDGQPFFNTSHPYTDESGVTQYSANTDNGAGTPWFLLCTKRVLKPMIFQSRKKPQFVSKDKTTDDNVFFQKEFIYGVDGRWNAGFGLWQLAWGSKQPLTPANYAIARAAIGNFKGEGGRPLGLAPDLLVVPPTLESDARKIVNSEYGTGGITNEWKGTAELMMTAWLA